MSSRAEGLDACEGFFESAVGTRLWYRDRGEGTAFVLCDGLGCDGFIWKYIEPDFAPTMRVVRWHYRSHGRSEPAPSFSDLTVEGLATDLVMMLDHLSIERAIIAGHSMGVQVILQAALDAPERVAALIPICGSYGHPLDTFKNSSAGKYVLPALLKVADGVPELLRQAWSSLLPSRPSRFLAKHTEINAALMSIDDLAPYLERLSRMDPRAFLSMADGASRHTAEDGLDEIDAPALVVAAERDTFTPMHLSVTMADRLRNAELFVMPDATHTGPLEWPEMLQLRMRRFFRDHGLMSS